MIPGPILFAAPELNKSKIEILRTSSSTIVVMRPDNVFPHCLSAENFKKVGSLHPSSACHLVFLEVYLISTLMYYFTYCGVNTISLSFVLTTKVSFLWTVEFALTFFVTLITCVTFLNRFVTVRKGYSGNQTYGSHTGSRKFLLVFLVFATEKLVSDPSV